MPKTPDEIKKGLECCKDTHCKVCPYFNIHRCAEENGNDALAYISQLESQNRCFKEIKESCEKRMIEMAQRMPSWISVEDRLPETGTWVLCWCVDIDGGKWHTVGKLLTDGIWAVDIYETDEPEYYTVTYWMPLPEPPKEG